VATLEGTGIPHAYLTFEGEQHGFRKAETLVAVLHAQLSFYGQVFGFIPPDVPALELRS
jgi:dipeptidyl aminopeptidase/acylaminoacyl peptidase